MTIQQMQYIVALNRHRHFVRAAEECGVAQPTLSAMIQKLEEELDVRLFDRNRHPVEPTEVGRRIIRQAETALHEFLKIGEMVRSEVETFTGPLHLGVIPKVAPYLVPQFIDDFRKNHPDVELSISEMRTDNLVHHLRQGQLDMAVLSTPLGHADLLEIPAYYERFYAYFAPGSGIAEGRLNVADMPLDQLWVLQEGHCIRNQIFNFCGKASSYNHVYEAGSIDTLVRIVDRNGGYTLIPELHLPFLDEPQRSNVREIADPPAVREISIVIRQDYIRERAINAVAEVIKGIIPQQMLDERLRKFAIRL